MIFKDNFVLNRCMFELIFLYIIIYLINILGIINLDLVERNLNGF